MSRFYNIQVGDLKYDGSGPNALQVEINVSCAPSGATNPGSSIRVWGIGLADISQSNNLYQKQVVVKGGMRAGLPLANPAQAGVLGGGMVSRAFGNWIGTEQTLEVIFSGTTPAAAKGGQDPKTPTANLVMNWKKGKPLDDALKQALQTAYPGFKLAMNIGRIIAPRDQPHFSGNIDQFSHYLRRFTQDIMGKNSQGVGLTVKNGTITADDGSMSKSGKTIAYTDLIGQPTWIDADKIQIKLVMRADLDINNVITLPRTLVTNQGTTGGTTYGAASGSLLSSSLTFQGQFRITAINHIGNSRQPDASAWVTVVEATTLSGSS